MRKPTPLKRAIFESGKTQKAIANAAGIDEAVMSRIVNGLHADEAKRAAIAAALAVDPETLWPAEQAEAA